MDAPPVGELERDDLVGDSSRPEIVAAFPSAPWANVAEGITEQRALELLRAAIGVPDIGVVIEDIATWRAEANCADRFRDGRVFLAGDAGFVGWRAAAAAEVPGEVLRRALLALLRR